MLVAPNVLQQTGNQMRVTFDPQSDPNVRSIVIDNVVIMYKTTGRPQVVGGAAKPLA